MQILAFDVYTVLHQGSLGDCPPSATCNDRSSAAAFQCASVRMRKTAREALESETLSLPK